MTNPIPSPEDVSARVAACLGISAEDVAKVVEELQQLAQEATPTADPSPGVDTEAAVQSLAAIIRAVDGGNSLVPSALAAAILAHPGLDWLPTSKATLAITN